MVRVAAAVVAHRGADRLRQFAKLAQHAGQPHGRHLRVVLHRRIQVGDIGRVMPVMVDLHGLRVDVRLVRVRRIGQRRQGEWAGWRGLGRRIARHENQTGAQGGKHRAAA